VVAEGYHAGLRAAGWTGSLDDVRLAMAAAMVAKFGWLAPFLLRAASERRERLNGRPFAEAVAAWAPTIRFLLAGGRGPVRGGTVNGHGQPGGEPRVAHSVVWWLPMSYGMRSQTPRRACSGSTGRGGRRPPRR
jgi:hypothetical protein